MVDIIQKYVQILIKENEVLDKLVKLGAEKKGCIIVGKVKELDKMIGQEGIIAASLEKMESERVKLHEMIADQWEVTARELTAETLLKKAYENKINHADLLREQIERMEKIIFQLHAVNRENNQLISASLEYIDNMQTLLIGDQAGVYSDRGIAASDGNTPPAYRFIDKKA